MLRVKWCACNGGGGPTGPSAMVPVRGERRAGGPWLLLRSNGDWGLLREGLHFFTGAGAGASEMMATYHLFCRKTKQIQGCNPPTWRASCRRVNSSSRDPEGPPLRFGWGMILNLFCG